MNEHKCEAMSNATAAGYGVAVNEIYYHKKEDRWPEPTGWYMSNGEYASGPIVCCPFCGEQLNERA